MDVPGIKPQAVIAAINARSERWRGGNRSPDGNKIGLVIEGGAMRGIRSAGGLLALEAMGLAGVFDEAYGCSAGAVNASYFLSGQGAYGTTIYYQNINNRKFINRFRLRKIVDLDFLFDHVMVHEKPLRVADVINGATQFYIAVTDVASGAGRIIHAQKSPVPLITLLKASSAMPIVYNEHVLVEGRRCIDGGVANSIPLEAAIAGGCTHILVLLTRPVEYLNPDAGRIERYFFEKTCGRNNLPLRSLHLRSDRDTNMMRDLACGRSDCSAPVSIATLAPGPGDVAVDRTTTNARRLKTAAMQYAHHTFTAFGADVDHLTEVLHPFKGGVACMGNGRAG